MKFGLALPSFGVAASKESIREAALLAEKLEYDSIWSTDHVLVPTKYARTYGRIFDALATLAYTAAITERVGLGTSILVLPMRNPVVVAKQVAAIDALSEGRVVLGLGSGWMEEEFAFLNVNFSKRGALLDEAIRALRVLWTEPSASFQGRFMKFSDAAFEPKPRQKNGPPIWIGGNSDASIRRAARLGDAWHPVGLTAEQIESGREKIESWSSGRKVSLTLRIAVDFERHERPTYVSATGERRAILVGAPSDVVRDFESYDEVGVEHAVCYFGDKPEGKIFDQARTFAKEVMPSFNK